MRSACMAFKVSGISCGVIAVFDWIEFGAWDPLCG